jgi:hypothetical protein
MMLQWFDTFVGMVVVLLGLSLIVMIVTQVVSTILNLRGRNLKNGIKILVENADMNLKEYAETISQKALSHPLISDTWSIRKEWNLATTVRPDELKNILDILAESGTQPWREVLQQKLTDIQTSIDKWFDGSMDRASQYFAMNIRFITVLFSIVIAFSLHLDAYSLFSQISDNPEIRAKLMVSSDALLKQAEVGLGTTSPVTKADIDKLKEQVNSIKDIKNDILNAKLQLIPQPYPGFLVYKFNRHFWGVLAMAGLLSLGAPFWFNILKRMSNLRPVLAGKDEEERKQRKQQEGV